ncbi:hypothetical protein D3C73_1546490 [compost metagenome]
MKLHADLYLVRVSRFPLAALGADGDLEGRCAAGLIIIIRLHRTQRLRAIDSHREIDLHALQG